MSVLEQMQVRRARRARKAGRCGTKYPVAYWEERPSFIGAVCHEQPGHEGRPHRDFTLGVAWVEASQSDRP